MTTRDLPEGGYRYIPAVFQYSAGVVALPGYEIVRIRFVAPVPLREGFARAARHMHEAGQPLTSFCACELRSPAPFSDEGFRSFNKLYAATLSDWGLLANGDNPVARSNVCPEIDAPAEPSFHAFCFTAPAGSHSQTFVVAGSGEAEEGGASYRERTVRYGDTSPGAIREKARFVLGEMERRLGLLGLEWDATTASQVYTIHDLHPFLGEEIVRRGAARNGLTWHFARPPISGLEFEMDCRGVMREIVVL